MVRPNFSKELCVICKGSRLLCGKPKCPILLKQYASIPIRRLTFSKELLGSSPPSFFVGHQNYPNILAGPMIPPITGEESVILDGADQRWFGKTIDEIVDYRMMLVRTSFRINVKKAYENRLLATGQEIAMAAKPVDAEAILEKEPKIRIEFDSHAQPMGPTAPVKKISLASEPYVPRKVDAVVSDTDLKAGNAVAELYLNGFSVNYINRLLSSGLLGISKGRKLVPTRWAITATDDISSKLLVEKIKDCPQLGEYLVFKESYLDNHFLILMIPGVWSFEQLEAWYPGSAWLALGYEPVIVQDHEFYTGRKSYASKVAGAYYAARLAVAEYLSRVKRQASIIVFREVHPGYILPLGVWVIRETVRNAVRKTPLNFTSLGEAIQYIKNNLQIPWKEWEKASQLLKFLGTQKTIDRFL
ncbi:MAG: Nre family DNA repair protein [Candidatus Jordarchaeaceae archaeon]